MRNDILKASLQGKRRDYYERRKGRHTAWKDAPSWERIKKPSRNPFCGNALRRYLDRQVGRCWDAIYSEMSEASEFDKDVLKSLVKNYLVALNAKAKLRAGDLYLDENRILRKFEEPKEKPQATPLFHRVSRNKGVIFWNGCWHECQMASWRITYLPLDGTNVQYRFQTTLSLYTVKYPWDALFKSHISSDEALHYYGKPGTNENVQYCVSARPMKKEEIRQLPRYITENEKQA